IRTHWCWYHYREARGHLLQEFLAAHARGGSAVLALKRKYLAFTGEVRFTLVVFAEGDDGRAFLADGAVGGDFLFVVVVPQGPDLAGDIVGVEIAAHERGNFFATIDVAAGDR